MPDLRQSDQIATIKTVTWDPDRVEEGKTYLSGTITVTQAVTAPFISFVIAAVSFRIVRLVVGKFDINFEYSGRLSERAVQEIVRAGAQLLLVGRD
jgi:hypothetical protein